jgi:hypothetical protein
MKNINLSIIILFVAFLLRFNTALAQETATGTGGDATGTGGTSSYSVGQILYTTNTGTNGSINQGVQQPYEISIVTEIEEAKEISLSFSVYPNPTTDYLKINIGNYNPENLIYQLFDVNGKLIETNKISNNETRVEMNNSSRGIYFLKIFNNNNELKTFQIVKN